MNNDKTDHTPKPYEQQPDESAQAYAAFLAYCEIGASRSIDAAWRATKGQQKSNARASGRWTKWSQDFNWVERAKAYDLEQAKARFEANKQAYLIQVEQYQHKRLEAASMLYNTALKLLQVVEKRLENVDLVENSLRSTPVTKEGGEDCLSIGELKAIACTYDLKTIAFAYGMATKGMQASFEDEAEGLAIDKLMKQTELALENDAQLQNQPR